MITRCVSEYLYHKEKLPKCTETVLQAQHLQMNTLKTISKEIHTFSFHFIRFATLLTHAITPIFHNIHIFFYISLKYSTSRTHCRQLGRYTQDQGTCVRITLETYFYVIFSISLQSYRIILLKVTHTYATPHTQT